MPAGNEFNFTRPPLQTLFFGATFCLYQVKKTQFRFCFTANLQIQRAAVNLKDIFIISLALDFIYHQMGHSSDFQVAARCKHAAINDYI